MRNAYSKRSGVHLFVGKAVLPKPLWRAEDQPDAVLQWRVRYLDEKIGRVKRWKFPLKREQKLRELKFERLMAVGELTQRQRDLNNVLVEMLVIGSVKRPRPPRA
jgi:hypothetical protein